MKVFLLTVTLLVVSLTAAEPAHNLQKRDIGLDLRKYLPPKAESQENPRPYEQQNDQKENKTNSSSEILDSDLRVPLFSFPSNEDEDQPLDSTPPRNNFPNIKPSQPEYQQLPDQPQQPFKSNPATESNPVEHQVYSSSAARRPNHPRDTSQPIPSATQTVEKPTFPSNPQIPASRPDQSSNPPAPPEQFINPPPVPTTQEINKPNSPSNSQIWYPNSNTDQPSNPSSPSQQFVNQPPAPTQGISKPNSPSYPQNWYPNFSSNQPSNPSIPPQQFLNPPPAPTQGISKPNSPSYPQIWYPSSNPSSNQPSNPSSPPQQFLNPPPAPTQETSKPNFSSYPQIQYPNSSPVQQSNAFSPPQQFLNPSPAPIQEINRPNFSSYPQIQFPPFSPVQASNPSSSPQQFINQPPAPTQEINKPNSPSYPQIWYPNFSSNQPSNPSSPSQQFINPPLAPTQVINKPNFSSYPQSQVPPFSTVQPSNPSIPSQQFINSPLAPTQEISKPNFSSYPQIQVPSSSPEQPCNLSGPHQQIFNPPSVSISQELSKPNFPSYPQIQYPAPSPGQPNVQYPVVPHKSYGFPSKSFGSLNQIFNLNKPGVGYSQTFLQKPLLSYGPESTFNPSLGFNLGSKLHQVYDSSTSTKSFNSIQQFYNLNKLGVAYSGIYPQKPLFPYGQVPPTFRPSLGFKLGFRPHKVYGPPASTQPIYPPGSFLPPQQNQFPAPSQSTFNLPQPINPTSVQPVKQPDCNEPSHQHHQVPVQQNNKPASPQASFEQGFHPNHPVFTSTQQFNKPAPAVAYSSRPVPAPAVAYSSRPALAKPVAYSSGPAPGEDSEEKNTSSLVSASDSSSSHSQAVDDKGRYVY